MNNNGTFLAIVLQTLFFRLKASAHRSWWMPSQ
jgi:hypothetical protein